MAATYLSVKELRNENIYPGPEDIKLFFMLNSAEHEIFSAYKYENDNNS